MAAVQFDGFKKRGGYSIESVEDGHIFLESAGFFKNTLLYYMITNF